MKNRISKLLFSLFFLYQMPCSVSAQQSVMEFDIKILEAAANASKTLIESDNNEVTNLLLSEPLEAPMFIPIEYQAPNINLSSGRGLACEALLCAVGIAIPASHSKCRSVLREWAIYLATLSWFRSTPKCPIITDTGEVVGHNDMTCDVIQDLESRQICEEANNIRPGRNQPVDPCAELVGVERELCEVQNCNRNGERMCQIN